MKKIGVITSGGDCGGLNAGVTGELLSQTYVFSKSLELGTRSVTQRVEVDDATMSRLFGQHLEKVEVWAEAQPNVAA